MINETPDLSITKQQYLSNKKAYYGEHFIYKLLYYQLL